MDEDKKAYLEDDLTEEDIAVLRLYEKAAAPVPWDESDDAILEMAHAATPKAAGQDNQITDAAAEAKAEDGENIVAFQPRQKFSVRRMMQSPAGGFAMAACLVLGVFAGQGMTPYVNLGVAPDYQALERENATLRQERGQTRSLTGETGGEGALLGEGSEITRLAGLLSGFSCADLSLTLSQGRGVRVAGHVGSVNDLRRLNAELANLGQTGALAENVRVYDWPLCEVLEVLAPYGGGASAGSGAPGIRLYNHGAGYGEGEALVVEVAASSQRGGYLYVDYFQRNGQVQHLLANSDGETNRLAPGEALVLGEQGDVTKIAPPFGTELVVVLQSPLPLFGSDRPAVERAQDYLKVLPEALNGLVARGRGDDVGFSYEAISTHGDDRPKAEE